MNKTIKAIAFYLPQYYPIPENDEWWGKGFTEWTNVTKAKPLFKGHYQPKLPADLGFYDLRVPEVREAQAELAKMHGIHGFCYWHYWFGNGKRILERPFEEVLRSGSPDFPFCLAWANESWTGIWHGLNNKTLAKQTYPGKEDYISHFNYLIKAFNDPRYITVEGKPLFMVYMPRFIPDINLFVDTFKTLAVKNGLKGLYLVATNVPPDWNAAQYGFDAITLFNLSKIEYIEPRSKIIKCYRQFINDPKVNPYYKKIFKKPTHIYTYKEAMQYFINDHIPHSFYHPMVVPNWDNSARSRLNSFILHDSTPQLFKQVVEKAVERIKDYPDERKIFFIKSWNEWAEGNYLEPDLKWGSKYLEAIYEVLNS